MTFNSERERWREHKRVLRLIHECIDVKNKNVLRERERLVKTALIRKHKPKQTK